MKFIVGQKIRVIDEKPTISELRGRTGIITEINKIETGVFVDIIDAKDKEYNINWYFSNEQIELNLGCNCEICQKYFKQTEVKIKEKKELTKSSYNLLDTINDDDTTWTEILRQARQEDNEEIDDSE